MFKELAPYLRQRAVLLTVTRLEDDQISVNIIPKKLQDSENTALTTPFKLTGTAEELDRDLPSSIVDFVASHLQLKSTLERAKAEMDAAGKAAQAEARAKKVAPKKEQPKAETEKPATAAKPLEAPKPEPPKTFSLFDTPTAATPVAEEVDEEEEILAETAAEDEEEDEELDQAA
ncbi:PRTRC system protein E [Acidicapsa ligni]|uniref:PRTRC system protein E n=1 Tax=Acidicapsa ligni TaxID=542300 RepID=UPI0021E0C4D0|nr:PRTRC system protein E [Acidicapsa ligni]